VLALPKTSAPRGALNSRAAPAYAVASALNAEGRSRVTAAVVRPRPIPQSAASVEQAVHVRDDDQAQSQLEAAAASTSAISACI
jgi:hypothetical protein